MSRISEAEIGEQICKIDKVLAHPINFGVAGGKVKLLDLFTQLQIFIPGLIGALPKQTCYHTLIPTVSKIEHSIHETFAKSAWKPQVFLNRFQFSSKSRVEQSILLRGANY